jgi:hypothetical protein
VPDLRVGSEPVMSRRVRHGLHRATQPPLLRRRLRGHRPDHPTASPPLASRWSLPPRRRGDRRPTGDRQGGASRTLDLGTHRRVVLVRDVDAASSSRAPTDDRETLRMDHPQLHRTRRRRSAAHFTPSRTPRSALHRPGRPRRGQRRPARGQDGLRRPRRDPLGTATRHPLPTRRPQRRPRPPTTTHPEVTAEPRNLDP